MVWKTSTGENKMNDECQYCLGMDSAIEKLKTEIDEYKDKLELSQPVYSRREMENKLKNRDQEISRLKAEVHELKHGKHHKYCDQWIKERDELIKEFLRLMLNTSMYFASEDARNVCDRARKMVGEG